MPSANDTYFFPAKSAMSEESSKATKFKEAVTGKTATKGASKAEKPDGGDAKACEINHEEAAKGDTSKESNPPSKAKKADMIMMSAKAGKECESHQVCQGQEREGNVLLAFRKGGQGAIEQDNGRRGVHDDQKEGREQSREGHGRCQG